MSLVTNWSGDKRVTVKRIKGKGRATYEVYARLPNGKRVRQRFPTQGEAEMKAEELRIQGRSMKAGAKERASRINEATEFDAIAAIETLKDKFGEGVWSLKEAADFVVTNFKEQTWTEIAIEEGIEKYLRKFGKGKQKLGKATKKERSRRLNRFAAAFPGKMVHECTRTELEDWVYGDSPEQTCPWSLEKRAVISSGERRQEWAALSHFLGWCVKNEHSEKNLMVLIDTPEEGSKKPEAYTPDDARRWMEAAEAVDAGSMVSYYALGLFAAVRPEEVERVGWTDLNWDEGKETLKIEEGKGARRRVVKLPPTCVEWLKAYKLDQGPFLPGNHKKLKVLVQAVAGFHVSKPRLTGVDKAGLEERIKDSDSDERPNVIHDGFRHSGITYRLRVIENAGAVAFWAGTSEKKVYNNYEGLVTDAEAEKYWAILPMTLS